MHVVTDAIGEDISVLLGIITARSMNFAALSIGGDGLGSIGTVQAHGLNGIRIPDGAIRKYQFFDLVFALTAKIIDGDAIGAVAKRDNQAVAAFRPVVNLRWGMTSSGLIPSPICLWALPCLSTHVLFL